MSRDVARAARILVVDDDPDFAETLAELLEENGHQVEVAFSGQSAIEKSRQRDFDLTFMDVLMPGLDGVDSMIEIRDRNPSAQVVLMTGYSLPERTDRALEEGAVAVMSKPVDPARVRALVEGVSPRELVLVAEDDRDFAEMLRETLTANGYSVWVAQNGAAALEQALAQQIDILVLDLRLPSTSGEEIVMALKASGRSIPTVVITGYAEEEAAAIQRLRSMEIEHVLTKPVDTERLAGLLRELSGRTPDSDASEGVR